MKIYAPKYYNKFKCIADKCTHSCCIGWEIHIDAHTMKKYRSLDSTYASDIIASIEGDDEPKFRMCKDGRCPHLDENGLCKIIIDSGEEYLSDICREHPRFYNESARGVEVGLGMACEEAARIILSSDGYRDFVVVGESEGEVESVEFDAIAEIGRIYDVLGENEVYPDRLAKIYREWEVAPDKLSDSEWHELLSGLEYLDKAHRDMLVAYSSAVGSLGDLDKLLERALGYFVYRHCASARDEDEFRASLGVALFFERLFASVMASEGVKTIEDATRVARIISEELEYSEDNTDLIKTEYYF